MGNLETCEGNLIGNLKSKEFTKSQYKHSVLKSTSSKC